MSGVKHRMRKKFQVENPEKYSGDVTKITARSRWELTVMRKLDRHPDVLRWESETLPIQYVSPVDNKVHKYYPDFVAIFVRKDGTKVQAVIEVKPMHEATAEAAVSQRSKDALEINEAKWAAARKWCSENKFEFIVLTENEIYYQGGTKR